MMRNWFKQEAKYTQTIFHPVGTCKMGKGDDSGARDEKLKVKGLENS